MFIFFFLALAFSIEPDFCTCAGSCTFAIPEFECAEGASCNVPYHNEPSNRTCGFKIAPNLLVTPGGEFYQLMCQKNGLVLYDLPEHGSCIDYSVSIEDFIFTDLKMQEICNKAVDSMISSFWNKPTALLEEKNRLLEERESMKTTLLKRREQEKLEKEENCVFACPIRRMFLN